MASAHLIPSLIVVRQIGWVGGGYSSRTRWSIGEKTRIEREGLLLLSSGVGEKGPHAATIERTQFLVQQLLRRVCADLPGLNGTMSGTLTKDEISTLPIVERLRLISELWYSIPPDQVPVPESHRRSLDEALRLQTASPGSSRTWDEVRDDPFPKK
jgi:putative addiction module component (TIGR02574 family)